MKNKQIGLVFFALLLIVGCKKQKIKNAEENIVGKWVQTNNCINCDTITFNDNNTFYYNNYSGDLTEYEIIEKDSVKIKYSFNEKVCFFEFSNQERTLKIDGFIISIIGESDEDIILNKI